MLKKTLRLPNGPLLTWYLDGGGERDIVFVSPPGMSVRHWSPEVTLLRGHGRLLAFDYRGSSEGDRLLTPEQAAFERCVDDLEAILDAEGVGQADFVAWCAGTWLVKALHERNRGVVRSLVGIGVGPGNQRSVGEFETTIVEIQKMVAEDPTSARRIVLRMRRVGLIRDEAYYQSIYEGGDQADSALMRLTDMLSGDLAASGLGFCLFDDATRLLNYLSVFQAFQDNASRVDDLGRPLTLIEGKRSLGPAAREPFAERRTAQQLAENVWHVTLDHQSDFILLERPRAIAEQIAAHWERSAPLALAASQRDFPQVEMNHGAR